MKIFGKARSDMQLWERLAGSSGDEIIEKQGGGHRTKMPVYLKDGSKDFTESPEPPSDVRPISPGQGVWSLPPA